MRRKSVFFSLLMVSTAVAAYCCDPWGLPVQQAFIQAGNVVVSAVSASSSTVMSQLNLIDGTVQDGISGMTATRMQQTASQRSLMEGRMAVREQAAMQRMAVEAVEQGMPAPQQDTSVVDGALMAELDTAVVDKIQVYDLAWSNRFLAPSPTDIGHSVIQRHEPYCSPEDVTRGLCEKAAIPALQHADLTINSIYQPGNGQYDTLSDQEHAAALAYVQNLTQPAAYAPPVKADPHAAGGELSSDLLSDQAVLALVAHSFHAQIAMRTRRHP